jgi:low density lipoprotein receptor-related protein 5/6
MSYHRPNQKYLIEDDYDDDIDEIMDDRFVENGEWDFSTVAIDYDPIDGKVYWTDQVRGIFNVFMNGTGLQEVITSQVDHPDGLAVDWLGRNLYWTDTGTDRIEVAKLDGTSRKVLISRYLDEPRDITLDPIHGWMYWSDWGVKANIERAWMDGSHRSVLVDTGKIHQKYIFVIKRLFLLGYKVFLSCCEHVLSISYLEIGWPNGIALDVDEQTLYWCDAKKDRIESINVDGTNRKIIMDQILPHPFGLTILGDYLYWTDWQEHTVERARKISGEDRRVLISHLEGLMSLQAVATRPDQV